MYTEHFGLNEKPFSISPDPRYLYLSDRHADALAHLLYGIVESGGFIQLTGEVGTGKTTLIRSVLGQLPDNAEIALILNPRLSSKQFLQSICHELRLPFVQRETAKALIDKLNARLLELHSENRRVVLIVDEAQTMSPELLEQVRLLTNLETEKQKLLQIILIGQPELRAILNRNDMRQIAQRVTGRYHLEPLTPGEAAEYVSHRLRIAGGRPEIFTKRAVRQLFRRSRGVPRLINIIADRALLAAYAEDRDRIGRRLVAKAAGEVFGSVRLRRWWPWAAAGTLLLVSLLTGEPAGETPSIGEARAAPDPPATIVMSMAAAAIQAPAENGARDTPGALLERPGRAREASIRSLFGLWDASLAPNGPAPCEQAGAQGLRCLMLDGTLDDIRALNRPAVLELTGAPADRRHVVLVGLDDLEAVLLIGEDEHRVSRQQLADHRPGSALLLFRPALPEDGMLRQGTRSIGVIWLRTCLESIGGESLASDEPELFDAELAGAVGAYQRERGLAVDGVVGDRTLASLQADIGLIGVTLDPGGD